MAVKPKKKSGPPRPAALQEASLMEIILIELLSQSHSLARIEKKIGAAAKQEHQDMAALDDSISTLTSDVTNETTVIQSAVTLIGGFAQQLADAIAAAQAAGATPAQLQGMTDLHTKVTDNTTALAAAVAAGTASKG